MRKVSLGIDIGSSSLKAVLYDCQARAPLQTLSETLDAHIVATPAGHYEEDPGIIRARTHDLIRQASGYAKDHSLLITRIAFTGQMHGGLFVDSALRPLSNFITWQDKRVDEIGRHGFRMIDTLRERLSESTWLETGGRIFTGFLGATAHWFISQKFIPVGTAKILGIYDWIASELCGTEAITDPSSASAWGLYSIRESRWSTQIVESLKIPDSWLPAVKESGEAIGQISASYANDLGLALETLVVSGTGDTQASYLGSGCKSDELLINIGTGSQCMWEHSSFALYPNTDTRYLSEGRYLITIPTLSGGLAYSLMHAFLSDLFSRFEVQIPEESFIYSRMNELALEAKEGASGVQVRPFFNGSRTKGEALRGAIGGLSATNFSISNALRATLEGMIEELAEPYFEIAAQDRPHSGIVGSGNGIRLNETLQLIVKQRFNLPMRLSTFDEEAAIGAAIIAGN